LDLRGVLDRTDGGGLNQLDNKPYQLLDLRVVGVTLGLSAGLALRLGGGIACHQDNRRREDFRKSVASILLYRYKLFAVAILKGVKRMGYYQGRLRRKNKFNLI
jgi:hypothetical protein